MKKIVAVAVREFLETVKTKVFLFGVIIMPGLIAGAIYGSQWLADRASKEQTPVRHIVVADQHGQVGDRVILEAGIYNKDNENQRIQVDLTKGDNFDEAELAERVRKGELYAYIIIPSDAVSGDGEVRIGRRDQTLAGGKALRELVRGALVDARFAFADPPVDREQIRRLQREVKFGEVNVASGQTSKDDEVARLVTPFVFMFLLYMGTFGISAGLLTTVLEEKSTRVVEVLLAAISPVQLMAGKILGMAAVGIIVLGVWLGVGYASAHMKNMTHLITVTRISYLVLYFIPAFLLMSAIMAGIGAACNTLKEAQSMVSPLSILNIVPMVMWFVLSQHPNGAFAVALSFIPLITPTVMILRLCADPNLPLWQIIATQVLLWISVIAAIWAAGKIFRVGVLMYGKPPTLRELARWVRYA